MPCFLPYVHFHVIASRLIVRLFQLLNKVAGIYGLIAVLTGAGGSFAQLSLYIYSAVALVALGWGLRAVKEVWTCLFSNLFMKILKVEF